MPTHLSTRTLVALLVGSEGQRRLSGEHRLLTLIAAGPGKPQEATAPGVRELLAHHLHLQPDRVANQAWRTEAHDVQPGERERRLVESARLLREATQEEEHQLPRHRDAGEAGPAGERLVAEEWEDVAGPGGDLTAALVERQLGRDPAVSDRGALEGAAHAGFSSPRSLANGGRQHGVQ